MSAEEICFDNPHTRGVSKAVAEAAAQRRVDLNCGYRATARGKLSRERAAARADLYYMVTTGYRRARDEVSGKPAMQEVLGAIRPLLCPIAPTGHG
jgi:hypothetical protein